MRADKTSLSSAKGQVTTYEEQSSKQMQMSVCVHVWICYMCVLQAQTAQRHSLQWWLLIHIFALRAVAHHSIEFLLRGVPLPLNGSCHQAKYNVRGLNFSTFCFYQLAETAKAHRNVSSVLQYISYGLLTCSTSLLLMLSRSIAASPYPCNTDIKAEFVFADGFSF